MPKHNLHYYNRDRCWKNPSCAMQDRWTCHMYPRIIISIKWMLLPTADEVHALFVNERSSADSLSGKGVWPRYANNLHYMNLYVTRTVELITRRLTSMSYQTIHTQFRPWQYAILCLARFTEPLPVNELNSIVTVLTHVSFLPVLQFIPVDGNWGSYAWLIQSNKSKT